MGLNKAQLVDAVAKKTELKKMDVEVCLKGIVDAISDELANGGEVTLIGFGTFKVTDRKERTGINPKDKSPITIAAKRIPKFKPGKGLSDKVDAGK